MLNTRDVLLRIPVRMCVTYPFTLSVSGHAFQGYRRGLGILAGLASYSDDIAFCVYII